MSLKAMYNHIAENYAPANRFGAISESHLVAIEQMKTFYLGLKPHYKVLDLGVGNQNMTNSPVTIPMGTTAGTTFFAFVPIDNNVITTVGEFTIKGTKPTPGGALNVYVYVHLD